ncbi:MAG TPA: hypothetical protein VEX68_14205 [Bryobacteraceae bacterium]|nr:hypothetical protein [Bryobacteraceae bacterium]
MRQTSDAMTQFNEAIARYHRILESESFRDLTWVEALEQRLQASHLTSGSRRVSPVLRPHFITQRQYANLVKAAEALYSAIDRIEKLALTTPSLMSRMQMLPAEKMLAAVDPGYPYLSVTSLLDTHLNNGSLQFVGYAADTPVGVVYGEALNNAFYDAPPVKEFRKKYTLTKLSGTKPLLQSLLKAYREFGGKKSPNIGILEFRQPFQSTESSDFGLLAEMFRGEGHRTELITPEQLEYRNGVLRRGDFTIDLIYRRLRVSEFLVRFDLNHPLVRAYRDRAVCVVNSFRSEMAQRRAIFDLLTDESIIGAFPALERKAIRDFIPWTRVVTASTVSYHDQTVDLPAFIQSNRERLILKPNDDDGERRTYVGAELDESGWDRALKAAMRDSYVVQEVTPGLVSEFPVHRYGTIEMREMNVDVHPHSFLGKVNGCSTWLSPIGATGFSTVAGLAPTFILESK